VRFLLWLFLLLTLAAPAVQADAPDVDAILRKLVENSEDPQVVSRRNSIAYQRTSRVEYLNDDGTKKRDTIRVFKISPENGRSVTRLISVNGRPAADKEDRNKSAARETGEKTRTLALNEELLSRFKFTFEREDVFASRPVWVLSFVPKADAPADSFLDKLINGISGTFWIDQGDHQLARADLRLSKRVSFFGGLGGAIDKLDLTLIQRRIEDSIWLGEAIQIDFAGRKLFSNIRFRCFENCADFQAPSNQHANFSSPE
jgi:hypothetical protein